MPEQIEQQIEMPPPDGTTPATATPAQQAVARLEAELAMLRAELDTTKTERESAKSESQLTQNELLEIKRQAAIKDAITAAANFINVEQVAVLNEKQIGLVDGKLVVLAGDGSPKVGVDGQSISLESHFKEFANRNHHLVRGEVKNGVGSTEASYAVEYSVNRGRYLRSLFGKGSSSLAANQLAMTDKAAYAALKREARSLRII